MGTIRYTFTAPDEPLFAFPVLHRSRISIGIPVVDLMGGPFGVDGAEGERARGLTCKNYDDKGGLVGPPFCYGGHRGTDFMLKGSFKQMDKAKNYVVAARAGKVIYVRDHLYDRCKSKFYSKDAKSLLQPDCGGRNKVDGTNFASNKIVIDHGGSILSWYVHLKKNSALVKVGDWVKCRQKIGEIGSSGMSTQPHLHFEVKVNGGYHALTKDSSGVFLNSTGIWGKVVDPFKGRLTQRGYWANQGSTRLPNATCAAGQPPGPVAAVVAPLTATMVQARCKPGYKLIGGKCQRLSVSVRKCKPGYRMVRGKCLLRVARPAITTAISKVKVAKPELKRVKQRENLCRAKARVRVEIGRKLRRVQIQRVRGDKALVGYRDGRRHRTRWVSCRSLRK